MEKVVVVGLGDVFNRFIAPALEIMEKQAMINVIATVDIKTREVEEEYFKNVFHYVRKPEQKLSEILSPFKQDAPVVILSHDNHLHYKDTADLVSSGFRVMLEKPYVIDMDEFYDLKMLMSNYPGKIFLLEYYLTRKMAPLFLLSGMIKEDSFYLNTEEVFRGRESYLNLKNFIGKLPEILGEPIHAEIKILESEGDSGKLDHRGAHVADVRKGGGMIMDMGIHAVLPLFALVNYLGEIDNFFGGSPLKIAGCEEFFKFAQEKHNIPREFIGETYAELNLITKKNVPVDIAIGKFIKNTPTKKNVIITGNKGKIDLDMHENFMFIRSYKDKEAERIDLTNAKSNRYYPVILAGLEYFQGKNSFSIDPLKIQLDSQELVIKILEKTRSSPSIKIYNGAEHYRNVFNTMSHNNLYNSKEFL